MSERGPSLTRQPCNMASAGTGSGPHVVGELFKLMAGVDLVHVSYRGSYWAGLLSGQVQVAFAPIPSWAHPSGYAARPRADLAAAAAAVLPGVAMTATRRRTNAANSGRRSLKVCAHLYSMATLRPSTKPGFVQSKGLPRPWVGDPGCGIS